MKLPTNGVAKELRHYIGSLFIFLLVMSIIFIMMKYPVLESNKEVVMMLIGTISASIGLVVSTITGSKPDDVNALKTEIDKKNSQIDHLVTSKDTLEHMIMDLQKQILDNQDSVMDKIILKAALEFDDRDAAKKALNKE
jgi:hypothetical protein|tara:strand:- start:893 stop:1309 length:417 start_codon:yes stop_codon:yes gene_type:complete